MSVWFHPPIFVLGSLAFVAPSGPFRPSGPDRRGSAWALLVSAPAAVLATILILAGSAIWTVIIKKAKGVNSWTVQPAQLPLGIQVSTGAGLYCAWVASGFLVASTIPLTIESASFFRLILAIPEP